MRVELERSSVANNQNSALSQIHLDPNTSIASQSPTQDDRDVASQPSSPVLEPEKDKKIPYSVLKGLELKKPLKEMVKYLVRDPTLSTEIQKYKVGS
ncbi:hypothetical protein RclHR1_00470009 [Rhizophagus clarus]|uniref:Uncharacterized protein n=1 Tax=Rhizophagus clarus TaxID=94130 RepID=A0A2Z6SCW3_9GLOM|nr:hypothetical protein RclHR1_00470009 [Rhizophagus clarus]